MHIVFLELIIDPACSIVFEGEPEETDVMKNAPRDPDEPLFRAQTIVVAFLQGMKQSALGRAGTRENASPLLLLLVVTVALCGSRPSIAAESASGEFLYGRYCASCHGVAGRGDGPVASLFRLPPPDLTRLDSTSGELMRQIDGRRTIRAHGSSEMPVWGEVFEQSLFHEPHRRRTALLKVQALADYVRSLRQRKDDAVK